MAEYSVILDPMTRRNPAGGWMPDMALRRVEYIQAIDLEDAWFVGRAMFHAEVCKTQIVDIVPGHYELPVPEAPATEEAASAPAEAEAPAAETTNE